MIILLQYGHKLKKEIAMFESVICIGLICFGVGYCLGTSHCMREDIARTINMLQQPLR
jgi:hypothetical protein